LQTKPEERKAEMNEVFLELEDVADEINWNTKGAVTPIKD